MRLCREKHKNHLCSLEEYHPGICVSVTGFKFIGEEYPDHLGNGPNLYPMNNPAFDKIVAKILEDGREDAEHAEKFLDSLAKGFKSKLK